MHIRYSDANDYYEYLVSVGPEVWAQLPLTASILTTGTIALARLGTGSPDSTKFLRGDNAWAAPSIAAAWPIGAVFISVVSTSPATLLGFGTWAVFGTGRVLVGIDAAQAEFDVVEETGGVKTHTLSTSEIPAHTHTQDAHNHIQDAHSHSLNVFNSTADGTGQVLRKGNTSDGSAFGASGVVATNQTTVATNQNTGGGAAHTNLQPYIVVYMWKRTA